MFIIKHRSFFLWLTGAFLVVAIGAIGFLGLPLSIDFTGGSLVEVEYQITRPGIVTLKEQVSVVPLGEVSLRESGERGVVLRSRTLSPEEHDAVIAALSQGGTNPVTELRSNSVGPSMGSELAIKALYAIGAVILTIMLYIAWAFRRVSKPVPSWNFRTIALRLSPATSPLMSSGVSGSAYRRCRMPCRTG